MSAPDKQRWPRATGLAVAAEVVGRLSPACAGIMVAGSLRRGKPDPADMFAVKDVSCAEIEIERMLADGFLTKRLNVKGGETWGYQNKLARHTASGMPVDLFGATRSNWSNNLVCRTGPAESNMRIAQAAQARGWKWNPYGEGFSRGGHDDVEFESRRMLTEAAVFEFVGLPVPEWAKLPTCDD